jgi:hypothetical protein
LDFWGLSPLLRRADEPRNFQTDPLPDRGRIRTRPRLAIS